MDRDLWVNKEGRSSPLHAVTGVADGVHELNPDESKNYVVHVGKGRYHKKTHGGVAFNVKAEFEVEVGDYMKIIVSSIPYCCE